MTEPDSKSPSLAKSALISLLGKLTSGGIQTLEVWDKLPQWLIGRHGPADLEASVRFLLAEKNKLSLQTDRDADWYDWLVQLTYSVSTVSALSMSTEAMLRQKAGLRTKKQAKKAATEKEIALNEAIEGELIANPSAKATKVFVQRVNRRLEAKGLGTVELRVVRTRLKKREAAL